MIKNSRLFVYWIKVNIQIGQWYVSMVEYRVLTKYILKDKDNLYNQNLPCFTHLLYL